MGVFRLRQNVNLKGDLGEIRTSSRTRPVDDLGLNVDRANRARVENMSRLRLEIVFDRAKRYRRR